MPEFAEILHWQPWTMGRLTPDEYERGAAYVRGRQRIEARGL